MARGSGQAAEAQSAAQGISGTAAGSAGSLYGTLAPELMTEAAHPSGFDPATMAKMDTASQQSAGGAAAGAVGAGGLKAARTRNAGGADAAIGESGRNAAEVLSKGVLGTQIENARLKQQQSQSALGELGSLYGTNTGASINALGQVANNVNANTEDANSTWDWTKAVSAIGSLGMAGSGYMK